MVKRALMMAMFGLCACSDEAGTPAGTAGGPATAGGMAQTMAGTGAAAAGGGAAGTGAAGTGAAGRAAAGTGASGTGAAGTGTAGTGAAGGGAAGTGTAGGGAAGTGTAGGGAAGTGTAGGGAAGTGTAGGGAAGTGGAAGSGGGAFTITSTAVMNGGMLPAKHRCMGSVGSPTGPSPAFAWSGAPAGTMSFALLMRDRTFQNYEHWTIYDIPASVTSLPEGVPSGAMPAMPAGAKQAPNALGLLGPGYYGPCGGNNMYEFKLYALDVATLPMAGMTGDSVEAALDMHDLATASLSVMSAAP